MATSRICRLATLTALLTAWLVAAQGVPVPLPKPIPSAVTPAGTTGNDASAPSGKPTSSGAATGADAVFTHQQIIDELTFEKKLASARGEDTKALQRLIDQHQQALKGAPPAQPFLGGAWMDPGTGASFSIYQEGGHVTVVTETLGELDELWERLEGTHEGTKVAFVLDGKEVPVAIEDGGKKLRWDAKSVWQRIPSLEGVWADPARDLVFTIAQVGTDMTIRMASEEGKKFWTELMGTQRGDRLVIETKDGFVSTTVAPTGDVIFWADDAKTKWVKLPKQEQ